MTKTPKFKYKFISKSSDERSVIQTNDMDLLSLLESFERFLRASGFSFSGRLDFVEDKSEDE